LVTFRFLWGILNQDDGVLEESGKIMTNLNKKALEEALEKAEVKIEKLRALLNRAQEPLELGVKQHRLVADIQKHLDND